MFTTRMRVALCLVITLAAIAACATSAGIGKDGQIPFPEGYRQWHHVKSMTIEQGHPLFDSFGGIHHVYANAAALAGLENGSYQDGAVFAFDLLESKREGNAVVEGDRKVLGVMHKSNASFATTGGWGFAGFAGGKNVVADMHKQCYACHASQQPQGFVFSTLRR